MPLTLSLVIPAFNEEDRLGPYLVEVRGYLDCAYPGGYEVIVVDDGSRDDTAGLVVRAAGGWPALRLLGHTVNQGKGAAVRTGVLASVGRRVLFADADGATPISDERALSTELDRGAVVAIGSRSLSRPGVHQDRNWRRALASGLFRRAVRAAVGVTVGDTQCGFKMFDGRFGRQLFSESCEKGYLLDVELLALARRAGHPVAEVAVNWSERPGSKIRLVRDSLRMLRDLWHLRLRLRALPPLAPATVGVRKAA